MFQRDGHGKGSGHGVRNKKKIAPGARHGKRLRRASREVSQPAGNRLSLPVPQKGLRQPHSQSSPPTKRHHLRQSILQDLTRAADPHSQTPLGNIIFADFSHIIQANHLLIQALISATPQALHQPKYTRTALQPPRCLCLPLLYHALSTRRIANFEVSAKLVCKHCVAHILSTLASAGNSVWEIRRKAAGPLAAGALFLFSLRVSAALEIPRQPRLGNWNVAMS